MQESEYRLHAPFIMIAAYQSIKKAELFSRNYAFYAPDIYARQSDIMVALFRAIFGAKDAGDQCPTCASFLA